MKKPEHEKPVARNRRLASTQLLWFIHRLQTGALAPFAVLQSLGSISNIPTNLLLHAGPRREHWSIRTRQLLRKHGIHMFWLRHVRQSWPPLCAEAMRKRGSDLCEFRNEGEDYLLRLFRSFSALNWIQLLLWSPSDFQCGQCECVRNVNSNGDPAVAKYKPESPNKSMSHLFLNIQHCQFLKRLRKIK